MVWTVSFAFEFERTKRAFTINSKLGKAEISNGSSGTSKNIAVCLERGVPNQQTYPRISPRSPKKIAKFPMKHTNSLKLTS